MAMAPTVVRAVDQTSSRPTPEAGVGCRPSPAAYLGRRKVPLLGSAVFVVVAVNYALWWCPLVHHVDAWSVPGDCWRTYFATSAFIHGHWGAVYASRTALITFPGILVLLAPAVALSQTMHLWIGTPYTAVSTPTTWLVLEPFDLLAGCAALFSIDTVARRLEIPTVRRLVMMAAQVFALWDLLIYSWHPEDALAVAFGLWGLLAAWDGRWRRAGWLIGLGIAFQPLLLLAVAAVVALAPHRARAGLLVRACVPAAVLLAGPLMANPRVTLRALLDQPNSTVHDHPTPWIHFAPHLGDGMVAAGPARLVAVVAAVVVSTLVCRRTMSPERLLWIVAVCFATRSLFEAVMDPYYVWPVLAVALVVAARASWARLAAACALSSCATVLAVHDWRGEWTWWSLVAISTGATVLAAWPARPRREPAVHAGRSRNVSAACGTDAADADVLADQEAVVVGS